MGSIRMVMLDGLSVADLLALRTGGFFEGATVQLPLPSGASVTPVPVAAVAAPTVQPVAPAPAPVVAAPAPVAPPTPPAPPIKLSAEQEALLAEVRKEAAEVRAELGLPPQEQPAPAPISSAGLPSVAQLAACTKLRDAMQLLIEGGMPTEELAAYLESVRDQVPLLGRISNIADRVSRTLSVMGQGG